MAGALISYGQRLHRIAMTDPSGLAILFVAEDGSEGACSWGDLDGRSTQLARVLQRRGAMLGDRIAVQLRNSPEFVIGCFAAWKVGAAAPFNSTEWRSAVPRLQLAARWVSTSGEKDRTRGSR